MSKERATIPADIHNHGPLKFILYKLKRSMIVLAAYQLANVGQMNCNIKDAGDVDLDEWLSMKFKGRS